MKTKTISKIIGGMAVMTVVSLLTTVSCKKETITETKTDTVKVSVPTNMNFSLVTNNGTDKINETAGTAGVAATDSGAWKLDKPHCNVMWETQYTASSAFLTGRFNMYDIKVNFDEANPTNTTINAWVQVSSFNTGEPGRDAFSDGTSAIWGAASVLGKPVFWNVAARKVATGADTIANTKATFRNQGCGMGYMGLKFDTAFTVSGNTVTTKFTPKATTDTAYFVSKSVRKENNYYIVTGDFTFRSIKISVDMKTGFFKRFTTVAATGKPYKTDKAGLYGEFTINANTVFGVNSTSINDVVKIRVDANFVSNKYGAGGAANTH